MANYHNSNRLFEAGKGYIYNPWSDSEQDEAQFLSEDEPNSPRDYAGDASESGDSRESRESETSNASEPLDSVFNPEVSEPLKPVNSISPSSHYATPAPSEESESERAYLASHNINFTTLTFVSDSSSSSTNSSPSLRSPIHTPSTSPEPDVWLQYPIISLPGPSIPYHLIPEDQDHQDPNPTPAIGLLDQEEAEEEQDFMVQLGNRLRGIGIGSDDEGGVTTDDEERDEDEEGGYNNGNDADDEREADYDDNSVGCPSSFEDSDQEYEDGEEEDRGYKEDDKEANYGGDERESNESEEVDSDWAKDVYNHK
ncbi:hypothetical protein FPQ18DRAFT_396535 [Pyronema domesticum]|uniref:Transcription factor Iwr1 domain-containing protein n=1 Tax=Pyronema omphalodes (strain CBS 100304) TaxID=1076935 RepID=U4LWU0_PYROM|nr:hypothetical protein FPQ18DRAFT_396535 [Pyronema domesticum]CCX34068.1 Protein of unknown function [Pyronema omphalodes CBS 100304]